MTPDVSPVPPTAAGPNENVLMVNGAQAFRWTGQVYEPILAPPVAPSVGERCKHERVEMLAHIDHETVGAVGTDLPISWSPICRNCGDDVPFQDAVLDSITTSEGTLEWTEHESGEWTATELDGEESIFWIKPFPKGSIGEGYFSLRVGDQVVLGGAHTVEELQIKANSLQRILSGAAE